MKPLAFLTACLLIATLIDLGLTLRQRTQIQDVSNLLVSLTPTIEAETGFEQRLFLANDPEALRQLARAQRSKSENAQHLAALLTTSFRRMSDAAILRSGLVLTISLSLAVAVRSIILGGRQAG